MMAAQRNMQSQRSVTPPCPGMKPPKFYHLTKNDNYLMIYFKFTVHLSLASALESGGQEASERPHHAEDEAENRAVKEKRRHFQIRSESLILSSH